MSDINQIVNVTITRENARVTRKGFGTPLVVGIHNAFPERVRTYLNITGVGEDFASTEEEYVMAQMLFGQALSPEKILIGKRIQTAPQSIDITIAGTPAEDDVFTVNIGRVEYSFTALTTPTVTDIAAGLVALIDAAAGIDAVNSVGVITVNATDSLSSLYIVATTTNSVAGTITQASSATGTVEALATTLDGVDAVNPDWYGLLIAKRSVIEDRDADILEGAAQAESREKLMGYSSEDVTAIAASTTDVFAVLQGLSRDRSTGIYSATAFEYPEAGWFGLQLPKDGGTTNWKFRTISGATPSILDGSAYTNLKSKNANFIETIGGKNIISSEGVVASGEYVDIIRGVDVTKAEIAEDTYGYLSSQEKVPFTNPGMIATANPTQAVLTRKANIGLYVLDTIIVNIPDVSEISTTDKANRQFKGTTFSAQFQGAINFVEIKGVVYP